MRQTDAAEEKTQPAVSRSVTVSRLRGYRVVIVRLLCLCIYVMSIGLVLASIPSYFASLRLLCNDIDTICNATGQLTASDLQRLQALGLSMDYFATYTIIVMLLFALGCWLVAALLFWRRFDNPLALLAAISLGTFPLLSIRPQRVLLHHPGRYLLRPLAYLAICALSSSFMCFQVVILSPAGRAGC
jgi:hypothetical protein